MYHVEIILGDKNVNYNEEEIKMKFNKIMPIILILTLTLIPVYSQQTKVKIEQSGYGQDEREVHFTVYNTGEIPITDVTFYVDGKLFKIIKGLSNPGDGFNAILILERGNHLIEIKTPEGAYDSLNLTISGAKETPIIEEPKFLEKNKLFIGVIVIIIIIVIVLWLLKERPKLKLK